MRKECRICGHAAKDGYTVTIKQGKIEIGEYTVCGECLEHNCLIESKSDDFQERFEETFGNPYLGSDFI